MLIFIQKEDIYNGYQILINAEHKINKSVFKYKEHQNIYLEEKCLNSLLRLFSDIKADNQIVLVSGLRNKAEQCTIYENSLIENGRDFTEKYVALPDTSEHQSGLAIDLGLNMKDIDFIRPYFPDEGICLKFKNKAADYGFVLRYPEDKTDITGIAFEPWHFRYVGIPHSLIMQEKELVLEEYISYIRQFTANFPLKFGKYTIFYLPYSDTDCYININDKLSYSISGNNIDGVIVTLWP